MYILYIYSIKKGNKKTLNTVKRRFYYNFNKKIYPKITKISNSSFYINEKNEQLIDNFFKEFIDWFVIFKTKIKSFEYSKSDINED